MTAEHIDPSVPIIGRPDRNPAALRVALAQVAPHRLAEMEQQKDDAIALAARTGTLGPILQFLETWAVVVEIARHPAAATRLRAAEYAAQVLDKSDPAWRDAMNEIHSVFAGAQRAVADG
ncbi:DUF6247 family protein [Streptomyces sp. SYSU K21746]